MICTRNYIMEVSDPVVPDCFPPEDIGWSEQQFPSGTGAFCSASMAGESGTFSVASQNIKNATAQNSTTVILTGTYNKLTPGSCVARFTFNYTYSVVPELDFFNPNFSIQLFLLGAPVDVAIHTAGESGTNEVSADGFIIPGDNPIQIWFQVRGSHCPGIPNGTPCSTSFASGTITLTPLPLP